MSVMSLKIPAIRANSVGPEKASLTHLWPGDIETEGPAVGSQSLVAMEGCLRKSCTPLVEVNQALLAWSYLTYAQPVRMRPTPY